MRIKCPSEAASRLPRDKHFHVTAAAGGDRSACRARAARLAAPDKFPRRNLRAGRRRSSRSEQLPLHLLKKRGKKKGGGGGVSVNRSVATVAGKGCCEYGAWKAARAELDPAPAAKLEMSFTVPDGLTGPPKAEPPSPAPKPIPQGAQHPSPCRHWGSLDKTRRSQFLEGALGSEGRDPASQRWGSGCTSQKRAAGGSQN